MILKHFKKKRKARRSFVLDFLPNTARPGGHSRKEDPFCGIDDHEHSRHNDFPDQSLQIGL